MSSRRKTGFTLVELLVVITIIGILMGLLMPAVSMVRESARRSQCANRTRQLAMAVNTFHQAKERYPGFREWEAKTKFNQVGTLKGPNKPLSWLTVLLPYLEQETLFAKWSTASRPVLPIPNSGSHAMMPVIPIFTCPSDTTLGNADFYGAVQDDDDSHIALIEAPETSYVANAGCRQLTTRKKSKANGMFQDLVFFDGQRGELPAHLRMRDLVDGASNTIAISENLQALFWHRSVRNQPTTPVEWGAGGTSFYQIPTLELYNQVIASRNHKAKYGNIMVWHRLPPGGNTGGFPNAELIKINGLATHRNLRDKNPALFMPYAARPSSNHRGGVVVGFADGHTSFITDGIDYIAYQSLMTPNNAKSSMPNPNYQLKSTDLGN